MDAPEPARSAPTPLEVDPQRRAAAFAALRSDGEVVDFPGLPGVLAAVSFDAVATGLRSVHNFGGSAGSEGVPEEDRMIAAIEEPRHGMVRRIINSVVAVHRSPWLEAFLRDLSVDLVDAMLADARTAGAAGVDVMAHLAEPIPPASIARMLGFPLEDSRDYYGWIRESGEKFQQAAAERRAIAIAESSPELAAYVDDRIAERMAMPRGEWPDDALTRFIEEDVDGERLTPRGIRAQIMFVIGAGSETTRNAIGSLVHRLGLDPAAYAALRADRGLVVHAIEESLRIDPPAQWMVRTCLDGMRLADRDVATGERVFMCIASANRDERVHDAGDEFDLERVDHDHLTFGVGRHICPGAALARMEISAAINAFLDRVASFRLVEPERFDPMPTAMLQGPNTLRIVVDEVGGGDPA